MVLLRKVIGDALRARRLSQRRTLREVSTAANVSLGYLSEIERGHKEASSELLASICDALGAPLSEMLGDVSATFALAEQMEEAFTSAVSGHEAAQQEAALLSRDGRDLAVESAELDPAVLDPATALHGAVLEGAALDEAVAALEQAVSEGDVTVQVHSDGPLRTTLITKRVPPGQRFTDKIFVG